MRQHTRGSAIARVPLTRHFDAQLVLAVGAMCPKFEKAIIARGFVGSLTGSGKTFSVVPGSVEKKVPAITAPKPPALNIALARLEHSWDSS